MPANPIASPSSEELNVVAILDGAISDYESLIASLDSLIVQRDALCALRDRTCKQNLQVDLIEQAASEKARRLVSNHERVAMAYKHLGATEVGDAERAVLEYIASLESQLAASRAAVPSGADGVPDWPSGICAGCGNALAMHSGNVCPPLVRWSLKWVSGASDTTSEEAAATVLYLRCGWCQATTPNLALMGEICPFCNTDGAGRSRRWATASPTSRRTSAIG